MTITSRANPLIKKIISLGDKKYRREYGEYLVEGVKPVNECIAAGLEISAVICTENLHGYYEGAITVSDSLFGAVSGEKSPQGVIAVVKLPAKKLSPPEGKCLLLDRLQDPGNLGTIIRTANAAGFEDIYLINCTDPFSPKAVRASMSGIFHVNIYEGGESEVLGALEGVSLICADMDGQDVFTFVPPEKYCLCIGNEGNGICADLLKRADFTVKIPMRDTCESLNAGVSAGIAMYALINNRIRRN